MPSAAAPDAPPHGLAAVTLSPRVLLHVDSARAALPLWGELRRALGQQLARGSLSWLEHSDPLLAAAVVAAAETGAPLQLRFERLQFSTFLHAKSNTHRQLSRVLPELTQLALFEPPAFARVRTQRVSAEMQALEQSEHGPAAAATLPVVVANTRGIVNVCVSREHETAWLVVCHATLRSQKVACARVGGWAGVRCACLRARMSLGGLPPSCSLPARLCVRTVVSAGAIAPQPHPPVPPPGQRGDARRGGGTTHAVAAREAAYLVLRALRGGRPQCNAAAAWRFKSLWAHQHAVDAHQHWFKSVYKTRVHSV